MSIPSDYNAVVDNLRRQTPEIPGGLSVISTLAFALVSPRGQLIAKTTENGLVGPSGLSLIPNSDLSYRTRFALNTTPRLTPLLQFRSAAVPLLIVGDSMADYKSPMIAHIAQGNTGLAGLGFGYFRGSEIFAGGADQVGDYTISPTGRYYTVPVGGSVVISRNSAYTACDRLRMAYIEEPGAASFQMAYSSNGSSWTDIGSAITASGASQVGKVTTAVSFPDGNYIFRVTGTGSGAAVKIIDPIAYHNNSRGMLPLLFALGGSGFNGWLATPPAILQPLLAAFNPPAVFFETRGTMSSDFSSLRALFDNAAPAPMDWIIGGRVRKPADTVDSDLAKREWEINYSSSTPNTAYFDQFALFSDAQVSDGTHLDAQVLAQSVGMMFSYLGWTQDQLLQVGQDAPSFPVVIDPGQIYPSGQPHLTLRAARRSDRFIFSVDGEGNVLHRINLIGESGDGDQYAMQFLPGGYKTLSLHPNFTELFGVVELPTAGSGIILKSPDGSTRRMLTLSNAGELVVGNF